MPKEYFQLNDVAPLNQVAAGGRIHVIGVAGVAMAQLAVGLSEAGYQVSGSDKEFYEPMGSFLRSSTVRLCSGYLAENVPADVALVVIGNSISYGNVEVAVVEQRGLPYTLFPQVLAELAIGERHSIVVTGTHGKTTTSAMCAVVLRELGQKPSYFIGGAVPQLPRSLSIGEGGISVVEGDEYDSAFFAKTPKFHFYRAKSCIVNAIEYDHADIYPDIEAIEREFETLLKRLPSDGFALCCVDFPHVQRLLEKVHPDMAARMQTFGVSSSAQVRICKITPNGMRQFVEILHPQDGAIKLDVPLPGEHNARNATAVYAVCRSCGLSATKIISAIAGFQSVRRRQDLRASTDRVKLIEDFAHHPTAVRETLRAIRRAYPAWRIVAVFEPRSNTSRRKVFEEDYVSAFVDADAVVLKSVLARGPVDEGQALLSVSELARRITDSGIPARAEEKSESILLHLKQEIDSAQHTILLVMSNGSFDGLPQRLEEIVRAQSPNQP